MNRVLIAGVIAGLIFFFWGFVVHMVIQLHADTIHPVPDEDAFRTAVIEQIPSSGVYFFPHIPLDESLTNAASEEAMSAFVERHEAGPIGLMFVSIEGREAMHWSHFAGGIVIFILAGLVASLLLHAAAPSLRGYLGRWLFVIGIGVASIFISDFTFWNWWPAPTDYTLMLALDHLIGWTLVGAVIAMIVTGTRASADTGNTGTP